jgi:hypothetical protein
VGGGGNQQAPPPPPPFPHYGYVTISRRFLICACAALLSPRVDALTLSIFVILSASLVVHVRAAPFLFPLNNTLETANLATVMFNYLAGILFSSNLLDNFVRL